jgi:F0F1-type ATP synthase assembly protein I
VPLDRSHLGAAISEHISPKSPAALSFANAAFRDAENGRDHAVSRWEDSVRECSRLKDLLSTAETRCAVLEERARQRSRILRGQQLAQTTGGVLAGAGMGMILNPAQQFYGWFVTGAGIIGIVIGTLFSVKEG